MRVVYTDPAWALDASGLPDPVSGGLERELLGPEIELDLGLFDEGYIISGPRFLDYVRGADALVIYRCQVDAELVAAVSPGCRVVARSGVGTDNLNALLLADHGIAAFNVPDYCGDEVSTHALALLLALERGICVQDRLVKVDRWGIHRGGVPRRTSGATAGIIGFGRIGKATARKLQVIYDRILAYDPYVDPDVMAAHGIHAVATAAELVATCDAVVLHPALTEETRGLVGRELLRQAKPGALLVNTARGALVDSAAVLEALESGRLAGFASDVFSPEDPNRSPETRKLLERDDVIVSSHRAFLSEESELSLRRRVAAGVRSFLLEGRAPAEGRLA